MRARLILAILAFFAAAAPALARGDGDPQSLDRILPEIRRTTPGTFYDAEGPFFSPDGQARYRIKWMTPDGRIIWFDADARTGRILGGQAAPPPRRFINRPDGFQQRNWPPSGYDGDDGDHDKGDRRGRGRGHPGG
ncbi:MAG: hypothetical protein KGJ78_07760 [Alphaproteobacteria bacterium]|nr:hypothetical protein [Alphaproteobacteria bacterium]